MFIHFLWIDEASTQAFSDNTDRCRLRHDKKTNTISVKNRTSNAEEAARKSAKTNRIRGKGKSAANKRMASVDTDTSLFNLAFALENSHITKPLSFDDPAFPLIEYAYKNPLDVRDPWDDPDFFRALDGGQAPWVLDAQIPNDAFSTLCEQFNAALPPLPQRQFGLHSSP